MREPHVAVMAAAARRALDAPSVLNTQPWRWSIGDTLDLWADHSRHLPAIDRSGRMLLTSCGAALFYARAAIAAAGWGYEVDRCLVSPTDDRLASVRLIERVAPTPRVLAMASAMSRRRTDRRPFAGALPDEAMMAVREAVQLEGMRVHRVRWDQMASLRDAAQHAITTQTGDPEYLNELAHWTSRDVAAGDGVAADTVVRAAERAVPSRRLSVRDDAGVAVPDGGDRRASFLVLYGSADDAPSWLRSGEALSAALLTAALHGVAASPMSDLIEVDESRRLVRTMLAGRGEPLFVLRCGTEPMGGPLGNSPRRGADSVIARDHPQEAG